MYDKERKEMEQALADAISEWHAARNDTLNESSELKHAREAVSTHQSTLTKLKQHMENLEDEIESTKNNVARLKEQIWILKKEWGADTNAVFQREEKLAGADVGVRYQEIKCDVAKYAVTSTETKIQSFSCELYRHEETIRKTEEAIVFFRNVVDEYEIVRRETTTASFFLCEEEAVHAEKMACVVFLTMMQHGDILTRDNVHRRVHEFVLSLESEGKKDIASGNISLTSEHTHRTPSDDDIILETDRDKTLPLVADEKCVCMRTEAEAIPFVSGNDSNTVLPIDIQHNVAMVKTTSSYKRIRNEDVDHTVSTKKVCRNKIK
jgi:uncharacterized protein YukE